MHTKNKSSNYFLKVYSKWYWPTCMCTVNNFGLPACSHLQLPPPLDLFPLFLSPTKDHTEGSFKALFNTKLEQQQKIKHRKIPLLVFFHIFIKGHQDLATSQQFDMLHTQNISPLLFQIWPFSRIVMHILS